MSVNWQETGDDNKKPVIFVHGAGGSSATWFQQLKGLSDSLHVIALELNGHGDSPDKHQDDVTRSYLDDIAEIVLQYEAPICAGHSMGGALTQLYALENPEHLGGIILIGTGARLRVSHMVFELLDNDFDGYIEALGIFMFHEGTPSDLIETSKKEARKCNPRIIRRDFELCDRFDIMQKISNIRLPTLIISGELDVMTPMKYSEYLHQNIPNSTLCVIKSAGHMVMLEQASEVNEAIKEWVNNSL